jgi:hypothetical protein
MEGVCNSDSAEVLAIRLLQHTVEIAVTARDQFVASVTDARMREKSISSCGGGGGGGGSGIGDVGAIWHGLSLPLVGISVGQVSFPRAGSVFSCKQQR